MEENFSKIREIVSEVEPDRAREIMEKYQLVRNGLADAIAASPYQDEATEANASLDEITEQLITADESMLVVDAEETKAELVMQLDEALSNIADNLGLLMDDTAMELVSEISNEGILREVADYLFTLGINFPIEENLAYSAQQAEFMDVDLSNLRLFIRELKVTVGDSQSLKSFVHIRQEEINSIVGLYLNGSNENADTAVTDFTVRLETFRNHVEGKGEVMEIPEDFIMTSLVFLGLSSDLTKIYYKAYLETPPEKRLTQREIDNKLVEIFQTDLAQASESIRNAALIEAFGKLVSGETENLLNEDALRYAVEQTNKEIEELDRELADEREVHAKLSKLKRKQYKRIGELQAKNPSWWQFLSADMDPHIKDAIHLLGIQTQELGLLDEKISELEERKGKLQRKCLVYQYQLLTNLGRPTTGFLLTASVALDGENVPGEFAEEMELALRGAKDNQDLSPVERAFYSGDYDETLRLLASDNRERTKINGFSGAVGAHDVLAAFRDRNETAKWREHFETVEEGSYAREKMAEGYIPVNVGSSEPVTVRGRTRPGERKLFLAKMQDDGSFSFFWVFPDGSAAMSSLDTEIARNMRSENLLSSEDVQEIDRQNRERALFVPYMIAKMPSLANLTESANVLGNEVSALSDLFAGASGWKIEEFTSLAKDQARKIKDSSALRTLKGNLGQARADLRKLRSIAGGSGFQDEFEKNILQMEYQLRKVTYAVEGDKLEDFCDHILSADFESASFGRWITETGIPFLTMIGVATLAIVTTAATCGGAAPLWGLALAGTVGGMVGYELGTVASHYTGQAIYGEEHFNNKTLLGKYITDEQIYEPGKGYRPVSGKELAVTYGTQFVVGFISMYALMGLGRLAGNALAKFAANNVAKETVAGSFSRFLQVFRKFGPAEVQLASSKGADGFFRTFFKQYLEEMLEEGGEAVGGAIHPGLGAVAMAWNALDGRRMQQKFGKFDVVGTGAEVVSETEMRAEWSYNEEHKAEFITEAQRRYGDSGEIEVSEDGTVTITSEGTMKDGTTFKTVMVFKASPDSVSMRRAMLEGQDQEGIGHMERIWGVKRTGDNKYDYDSAHPEGHISLTAHLQRKGFVIVGDPESGGFQAVKGNEIVVFGKVKASELIAAPKTAMEVGPAASPATVLASVEGLTAKADGSYEIKSASDVMLIMNDLKFNKGFKIVPSENGEGFTIKHGGFSAEVTMEPEVQSQISQMMENISNAVSGFKAALDEFLANPESMPSFVNLMGSRAVLASTLFLVGCGGESTVSNAASGAFETTLIQGGLAVLGTLALGWGAIATGIGKPNMNAVTSFPGQVKQLISQLASVGVGRKIKSAETKLKGLIDQLNATGDPDDAAMAAGLQTQLEQMQGESGMKDKAKFDVRIGRDKDKGTVEGTVRKLLGGIEGVQNAEAQKIIKEEIQPAVQALETAAQAKQQADIDIKNANTNNDPVALAEAQQRSTQAKVDYNTALVQLFGGVDNNGATIVGAFPKLMALAKNPAYKADFKLSWRKFIVIALILSLYARNFISGLGSVAPQQAPQTAGQAERARLEEKDTKATYERAGVDPNIAGPTDADRFGTVPPEQRVTRTPEATPTDVEVKKEYWRAKDLITHLAGAGANPSALLSQGKVKVESSVIPNNVNHIVKIETSGSTLVEIDGKKYNVTFARPSGGGTQNSGGTGSQRNIRGGL